MQTDNNASAGEMCFRLKRCYQEDPDHEGGQPDGSWQGLDHGLGGFLTNNTTLTLTHGMQVLVSKCETPRGRLLVGHMCNGMDQ